jgi:hypothetical protein
MTKKKHLAFTFKIVRYDMYLNWFLGFVIIFFPELIERLLSQFVLFPIPFWMIVGSIFLGYAFWQVRVLKSKKLGYSDLMFTSFMAYTPAIVLFMGLLFFGHFIRPLASVVLWIVDIYMFLLSGWYLFLIVRR